VFGSVVDAQMAHNESGVIAVDCWEQIPYSYPGLGLHTYVVMPNHVHGIIEITANAPRARTSGTDGETVESRASEFLLSQAVGSFKAAVTRGIDESVKRKKMSFWYPGFMDRIIRNQFEYDQRTQYILNNPRRWHEREERRRR
jgi:REP element-mobilizing transposase RayT